jgi:hypothetical protein
MSAKIKRREFITLLGGAAAAWPLAARAQQPEGGRRIGVLMNLAERDPEGQARIGALREGLAKLGRTEGREWQKPLSKLPSPGRLFLGGLFFAAPVGASAGYFSSRTKAPRPADVSATGRATPLLPSGPSFSRRFSWWHR